MKDKDWEELKMWFLVGQDMPYERAKLKPYPMTREELGSYDGPEAGQKKPEAKRDNKQKPRPSLIPSDPMMEVAKVLTHGADRYGDWNWRKGGDNLSALKILDSLERHLLQLKKGIDKDLNDKGESDDSNTGCHHMAHIIANALFFMQLQIDNNLIDDRWDNEKT